jgi:hypothetical protein
LGKIERLNEAIQEKSNFIEVQKNEISRLSFLVEELSNPDVLTASHSKKRDKPNPDINMVGLATSSIPLTNSGQIKEKKSWADSEYTPPVSDSEDVAAPKLLNKSMKSARQAAKSIPQEATSSKKTHEEKLKICHAMWFTGRCQNKHQCEFEHVRHPKYEKFNPFINRDDPQQVNEVLLRLHEMYEIPPDRRSPMKEKKDSNI